MIPGMGGTPEPDDEVPRIDMRGLGRILVRVRDRFYVTYSILDAWLPLLDMSENTRISAVRIPASG